MAASDNSAPAGCHAPHRSGPRDNANIPCNRVPEGHSQEEAGAQDERRPPHGAPDVSLLEPNKKGSDPASASVHLAHCQARHQQSATCLPASAPDDLALPCDPSPAEPAVLVRSRAPARMPRDHPDSREIAGQFYHSAKTSIASPLGKWRQPFPVLWNQTNTNPQYPESSPTQ